MYRGSSSKQARDYKLAGHVNEQAFSDLIGGSTHNLPPQGKTDCIGPDGERYSVKKRAKKWQVFLYGESRLMGDEGFARLSSLGLDLSRMLKAFPAEYGEYLKDKNRAKDAMRTSVSSEDSGLNVAKIIEIVGESNLYIRSKITLSKVNQDLAEALNDKSLRQMFFKKALFNGGEVTRLSIQQESGFSVYQADDAVRIFAEASEVATSGTGGHKTDISVPGQKILMKAPTNLVELEVRNDSVQHYRQLRFNMNPDVATRLLSSKTKVTSKTLGVEFRSFAE